MQKLIKEQDLRRRQLSSRFVAILVAAVVVLSVARVVLANWLVESSETLRDLDSKITKQSEANQVLAEQLREKSSLTMIENQARTGGFAAGTKLTFVKSSGNLSASSQISSFVR